jgi:hypothetical protein
MKTSDADRIIKSGKTVRVRSEFWNEEFDLTPVSRDRHNIRSSDDGLYDRADLTIVTEYDAETTTETTDAETTTETTDADSTETTGDLQMTMFWSDTEFFQSIRELRNGVFSTGDQQMTDPQPDPQIDADETEYYWRIDHNGDCVRSHFDRDPDPTDLLESLSDLMAIDGSV